MAYDPVSIAYKQEAASDEINQLDENVRTHDHRADGSQGKAMVGAWIDCSSALVAAAGWAKSGVQRYRLLLGGAIVEYDFAVTRSGASLVASNDAATWPGNLTDATVLSGIPDVAEARPGQFIVYGQFSPMFFSVGGDEITIAAGTTSGVLTSGALVRLCAILIGNV